jgi:hypothetical protein
MLEEALEMQQCLLATGRAELHARNKDQPHEILSPCGSALTPDAWVGH